MVIWSESRSFTLVCNLTQVQSSIFTLAWCNFVTFRRSEACHTTTIKISHFPPPCFMTSSKKWKETNKKKTILLFLNLKWALFFIHRSHIFLDLQRVPDICEAGYSPLHLTGDRKSVHRQSGALRCWQLHLCGDQHRHQDPSPGSTYSPRAPQWWWVSVTYCAYMSFFLNIHIAHLNIHIL